MESKRFESQRQYAKLLIDCHDLCAKAVKSVAASWLRVESRWQEDCGKTPNPFICLRHLIHKRHQRTHAKKSCIVSAHRSRWQIGNLETWGEIPQGRSMPSALRQQQISRRSLHSWHDACDSSFICTEFKKHIWAVLLSESGSFEFWSCMNLQWKIYSPMYRNIGTATHFTSSFMTSCASWC